jgi:hypothetical protein
MCFVFNAPATVRYVNLNCANPVSPYTSWATAATDIQDAVDAASAGDTVLVTNGVYATGGRAWFFQGTNRVTLTNAITLQSVNGPAVTLIVGSQVAGTGGAVRCVGIGGSAVLSGFTLTNGAGGFGNYPNGGGVANLTGITAASAVTNCVLVNNLATNGAAGGGAYRVRLINCQLSGNYGTYGGGACACTLVNCTVTSNTAASGGGVYGATPFGASVVTNCTIAGNSASSSGGGVYGCTLYNSLLAGNGNTSSVSGGAAYGGVLNNCTIIGNASHLLGAADGSTLANSIIYYNNAGSYADCYQCTLTNCCTPSLVNNGVPVNCITNPPAFVDMADGNYRLQTGSPCIDAGTNVYAPGSVDLDGNPRIIGAAVDMGAYENQNTNPVHYVSLMSTNPVTPYTNWLTAATNLQDAVAAAQPGDIVVAYDGCYTNGGTVVYGGETNRVALTNAITLMSLNGQQAAMIIGGQGTRCVYVGTSAALIGFTLTNGNGSGSINGDITNEQSGGGAWCAPSGVVSNCFIVANNANPTAGLGGGVFGGTIYNCTITNNNGAHGAAAAVTLYNCTVTSNFWLTGSELGGGLYYGTASNCVIVGNRAYFGGAGVYRSTVYNSTILGNVSSGGPGAGAYQSQLFNCSLMTNYGGGAYQGDLSNCIVSGNGSPTGGGTYQSTNYNCLLSGNVSQSGGGMNGGVAYNCILSGNVATNGGGAYIANLYNCTVVSNTALVYGGGAYEGAAYNSIIYFNTSSTPNVNNCYGTSFSYCCTIPDVASHNTYSVTNPPVFANAAAGDYHEQTNSPTINDGSNLFVTNSFFAVFNNDYDCNPRVVGGTVDIGAYEYQGSNYNLPVPIQWLRQYGLPTDGSADYVDSDGSGMNNWQKWIAGLNPIDPTSVLAMLSPVATNNSSGVTVSWQSVSGINYFIQRSGDLSAQPPFTTIQSNIAGQAGSTSYTDTTATNGVPYFYRVGVQ